MTFANPHFVRIERIFPATCHDPSFPELRIGGESVYGQTCCAFANGHGTRPTHVEIGVKLFKLKENSFDDSYLIQIQAALVIRGRYVPLKHREF